MTISGIRQGIATNLATIGGLTAYDTIPDKAEPPCAIVMPANPFGDIESMGRGIFTWRFRILILVSSVADEAAQTALDGYLASSGSSSALVAIESARTLGGNASDCRVEQITTYGDVPWNELSYWGAELQVRVLSTG